MIRKKIFASIDHELFRHRGHEIVRIEALSDAVFAFAVSLLVVSLEVPQTFNELMLIVKGAIPFFATIAMLFQFWYRQYIFFRRYGMNDFMTILLNLVYLAVILFYIYPLKFLFSLLLYIWTGMDLFPKASENGLIILENYQFHQLIILFSIGYLLIWLTIYGWHKRALINSVKLDLNRYEIIFTQRETSGALLNSLIGLLAIYFAIIRKEELAGYCYLLIPLIMVIHQIIYRKALKKSAHK